MQQRSNHINEIRKINRDKRASDEIVEIAKNVEGSNEDEFDDSIENPENEHFDPLEKAEEYDVNDFPPREVFPEDILDREGRKTDSVSEGAHDVLAPISEYGLEFIAFYKSFRYVNQLPYRGRWGIFIVESLVDDIVMELASDLNMTFQESFLIFLNYLYNHELFHFHTDAASLHVEGKYGKNFYRVAKKRIKTLFIDEWFEESIAEHKGLKKVPGVRLKNRVLTGDSLVQWFVNFVEHSPGAYKLGSLNVKKPGLYKWPNLSGNYGSQRNQKSMSIYDLFIEQLLVEGRFHLNRVIRGRESQEFFYDELNNLFWNQRMLSNKFAYRNCPIYWIKPYRFISASLKSLATISLKEGENFVKKYLAGKDQDEEGKSLRTDHSYYKIDNGEKVKFPNNHLKDLKPFEFTNIRKKAGMTSPEFSKERSSTKKWKHNCPRKESKDPIP